MNPHTPDHDAAATAAPTTLERYRPTMSGDVLHAWAVDAQAELETLREQVAQHAASSQRSTARPEVELVLDELRRAMTTWPTWPTDPLHGLAVLGEEFGELTKDVVQMVYEPHKTTRDQVRTEAIQTAAMALRFVASLENYVYAPCDQHHQRPFMPPATTQEHDEAHQ